MADNSKQLDNDTIRTIDRSGTKTPVSLIDVGGGDAGTEAILGDAGVALPTNVAKLAGTTTDTNSGNKSAGTLRVVIATDQPTPSNAFKIDGSATIQPVKFKSLTGTTTQVADTASSTTLLASNGNRMGAMIFNDSTATLYVKLGTTASTTDYTVQLVSGAYYEVPFGYTGRIDGIWASDPNTGSARITEMT